MKAVVAAFNHEKALVGAFSVIVQPVVEPMDRFAALAGTDSILGRCAVSAVPPCTAARVQCPQPDSANLTIVWLQQFAGPPLGGRCDYVELETKVAEDYTKFYNHGEGSY